MIVTKDTLIIVYYINMEHLEDESEKIEFLDEVKSQVLVDGAYTVIIPIYEKDSYVECLNPKYLSEEEYKQIESKIKQIEKDLDKMVKKLKDSGQNY